jgi:acyl-homoserine-lactone acylase
MRTIHPIRQTLIAITLLATALPELRVAAEDADALARQVTIRRTDYGVPHVLAENYRALGFGFGYAQAEDHLHSIARLILEARGELALNFGPGSRNANIESDFRSRQYQYLHRATETYDELGADWRAMTEGFAAGLNYYIEVHRGELEDWIQPVTRYDVAAHGLAGVGRFAFDRGGIVRRFVRSQEGGSAAGESEDAGSNLWAFDGTRTKSGKAILMGNPHQPWSTVATYYEAHLTVPGKLNFYGSTFIGRPVLTTGFNDYLGWTHTVNYPDLEEIYALDVNLERADHYLLDGKSVAMTYRDETVRVAETVEVTEPIIAVLENADVPRRDGRIESGEPGGTTQNVARRDESRMREITRRFWYTPLGPVIYRTDTQVFVLKSVAWDQFEAYEEWFQLEHAKDLEEFRAILDDARIPMFNIGYADRDGNIMYVWYGTIPELPHAKHEAEAVYARGLADIWTEVHAVDELPQLVNPKGGYVMNSNSAPYFTNLHAPMDRFAFPAHFEDNRFSLRSQHSMVLIHNDDKFSLEDVVALKFDERALTADRVKDDVIRVARTSEYARELAGAIDALEAWDNTTARESRGGVLFDFFWRAYIKGRETKDEENFAVRWLTSDPLTTPRGIRDEARALEALREAAVQVRKRYGALDVPWGDVHRLRQDDGTDLAIGGSENYMGSFRIIRYRDDQDGKRKAYSGDSWVFAVEFGDVPRAYTVVAYSESEYPESPHHSDQAELFVGEKMKPARFTEAEIEANQNASYHPGEKSRSRPDRGRTD